MKKKNYYLPYIKLKKSDLVVKGTRKCRGSKSVAVVKSRLTGLATTLTETIKTRQCFMTPVVKTNGNKNLYIVKEKRELRFEKRFHPLRL